MSLIIIPNVFSAGATIIASQHNTNFSTIYSDYNGNIDDTNISGSASISYSKLNLIGKITNIDINSSAGIVDTKLAQITTASKVHGSSITGLASLPSGAGVIPLLNLPSVGIPSNIQVFTTSGTWTKPAGISTVYVKVWGAGGGGGGSANGSNNAGTGATGGTSSFAGTTTIQATGGAGGTKSTGGAGGVGSNGTINLTGASGGDPSAATVAGQGGRSLFLIGESAAVAPNSPNAAYGYSHGGSGNSSGPNFSGGGGGAGGYSEGLIAVTGDVTVTVSSTGGAGGAAGTSGGAGVAGAGGYVIVYY